MSTGVRIKLVFEGQQHQMDLDTLISSLLNFAELTRAASNDVMPGEKINIKIDATDKGSFEVLLELCSEIAQGILQHINWDNINKIENLISVVVGIMAIKLFLKGEKPQKVESQDGKTTIHIKNSTIIVSKKTFDIYVNNAKANDHLENLFDKLSERPEVEGLTIEPEGKDPLTIKSDDFPGLSQKNELIPEEQKNVKIEKADLTALKVVFQRNRKWEFIHKGNKVSAEVVDENFWNQIDSSGVRFGKGDSLAVKLEITQIFDSEVNAFLNKSYKVLEIIDYKQAPQQRQMGFDKE